MEKQKKIIEIIRNIVDGGDGGDDEEKDEDDDEDKKEEYQFKLDIEICNDLQPTELDTHTNSYTKQMTSLKTMTNKDGDLK